MGWHEEFLEREAADKLAGIRRTRFADFDDQRGRFVELWIVSHISGPVIWIVSDWFVPLLDFRDVYGGPSFEAAREAWLQATDGRPLFDTRTMSLPGFGRRTDVPRWLYGEIKDIALRAIDSGQYWPRWTSKQWSLAIWPKACRVARLGKIANSRRVLMRRPVTVKVVTSALET